MAKIIAPNKDYTGLSAGVSFVDGIGSTDDAYLIAWFEAHGYTVENKEVVSPEVETAKTEIETEIGAEPESKESSKKSGKGK